MSVSTILALDAVGLEVDTCRVDGLTTTFEVADPELLIALPAGGARP